VHSWVWIAALALAGGCSFDEGGIAADGGGVQPIDGAQIDGAGDPADAGPDAPPGAPDATPDAMPDASLPDGDGDGVPDVADNCPGVGNPLQEDEDLDGDGDACDNCPTVANASQANDDEVINGQEADAVGDICDPRPDDTGDSILFFDGFNGNAPSASWVALTGTWTVAGGALHQTLATSGAAVIYWNGSVPANARADTDLVIDTITPAFDLDDNSRSVGLLGRYTPSATSTGYMCLEYADPNDIADSTSLWLLEFSGQTIDTHSFGPITWDMAVADPVRVRFTVRTGGGSRQSCSLRNYAAAASFVGTGADTTLTTGSFGLFTSGVAASFPYFIVYELGG
jgi:hypothetical protein